MCCILQCYLAVRCANGRAVRSRTLPGCRELDLDKMLTLSQTLVTLYMVIYAFQWLAYPHQARCAIVACGSASLRSAAVENRILRSCLLQWYAMDPILLVGGFRHCKLKYQPFNPQIQPVGRLCQATTLKNLSQNQLSLMLESQSALERSWTTVSNHLLILQLWRADDSRPIH